MHVGRLAMGLCGLAIAGCATVPGGGAAIEPTPAPFKRSDPMLDVPGWLSGMMVHEAGAVPLSSFGNVGGRDIRTPIPTTYSNIRIVSRDEQHALLHLVWHGEQKAGEVVRERYWLIENTDAGARMAFFTLGEVDALSAAQRGKGVLSWLRSDAAGVTRYPDTCLLPISPADTGGWSLRIPQDCVITARSGRDMRLEAEITVAPEAFTYRERGVMADGTVVFAVPEDGVYHFRRSR